MSEELERKVAFLTNRLLVLEEHLRAVRGRLEVADDDVENLRSDFNKFIDDINVASGAPKWEYPAQVIRDVEALKLVIGKILHTIEHDQDDPFLAAIEEARKLVPK